MLIENLYYCPVKSISFSEVKNLKIIENKGIENDRIFAFVQNQDQSKIELLISDTVGFIRKIPHNLIASFRTTLSEIKDADLIIKVVDISANDYEGHIATIENTLEYLGASKCPVCSQLSMVFSKRLIE